MWGSNVRVPVRAKVSVPEVIGGNDNDVWPDGLDCSRLARSLAEIKKEHESIAKNLPTGRRGVWDRVSRIIFEAIRVFSQCRRR